ncbi:MAG: D-alanyl-D-alanine carboxypeptidase DacB [Chlamydiae bacterium]|nr:D-alanyl-D-alanine carboxypeptidase DacB [Chlamydiota bacterium]
MNISWQGLVALVIFVFVAKLEGAQITGIKIHSHAAILIDGETKQILYEKNAFEKHPPASITKVPTLVYALKKLKGQHTKKVMADQDCVGSITKKHSLQMKYNYPAHWMVLGGTHMSIHKNELIKLNDLLYGMMIVSANDAANIVAKYSSGSISGFMGELNQYLKTIGCRDTQLRNPHGLHYPKHLTTAYDMAVITVEGMKDPIFREIFKATERYLPGTNKQNEKKIKNRNKLLKKGHLYFYPYIIGAKSGYHDQAKSTLVAAAKKNGKTLIVVLLQCPGSHQKYEDAITLFKAGFQALK